MENIRLRLFDIVLVVVVGLTVIFSFIPVCPGENNIYSLLTYIIEANQNGGAIHIVPFSFYIIFSLMAIALNLFNKKSIFRVVLFIAAVCMLLLCMKDWPTRTFSLTIGIIYVIVILASVVFDALLYRHNVGKAPKDKE